MKPKEADIILLEALLQTPNSRADYFRITAKEGNHDPLTFYFDLHEAYQRIEEYVNTDDMGHWGRDEAGNPVYDKQYIWLYDYTGGRVNGSFTRENLLEILEPLHEFGLSIKANVEKKMERKKPSLQVYLVTYQKQLRKFLNSQSYLTELDFINVSIPEIRKEIEKYQNIIAQQGKKDCFEKLSDDYIPFWLSSGKEFLLWLEKRKSDLEKPDKPGVKSQSFTWTGSQPQLVALWQALNDARYIDPKTTEKAFTAIFADELKQCEPVKWNGSNRLLSYLFNQLYAMGFIIKEWQSIIEKFQLFKNKRGKPITAGDLSTALSNINEEQYGVNPKGAEEIDAILETLRP